METLAQAGENVAEEVVGEKGYHSGAALVNLQSAEVRTYIPEKKQPGHRHWEGKAEEQQAVYANRRRLKGAYGKRLLWKRGELIERSFAHCYDTGRMRRTHLRGHENILKRLLIHVGAFNLSLIFRNLLGSGRRESREIASHRPFLRSFSCSATLQCLWVVQLCFFIGKTQLVSEAALSTIQTPARKITRFRHGLLGMPTSISLDPAKLLFRMPTLNEPERFTPLVLIGTENAGRLDKACPDVLSPGDA